MDEQHDFSRRTATQRWMARLAFSFIIIAGFLLWQAFEVNREPSTISPRVRFGLYLLGALCSALLAGIGLRERHRREQ